MRRARAAAVRPCVDAARDNRRDGAASAVVPEPKRDFSTAGSRPTEIVAAERRSDVGRAGRGVRRASAAAVRPFVDAARGNRRDGAASAVAPEPKRDLRRRAARSVTAEDATDENRRAGIVAAERRSNVGRAGRGVRRVHAVAVMPHVDAARGDRVMVAAAAIAGSRRAEREVGRAECRVRLAHTVAARPCVVDAR